MKLTAYAAYTKTADLLKPEVEAALEALEKAIHEKIESGMFHMEYPDQLKPSVSILVRAHLKNHGYVVYWSETKELICWE